MVKLENGFMVEHAGVGFTVLSPTGQPFAWAETMTDVAAKVAREQRERLFH